VKENLLYGHRLAAQRPCRLDLDTVTEFLGIGHLLSRWPRTLSGGEAQRVAIGRALLSAPDFLLLDEPLASVDSIRRQEILGLIERLRDEIALPILYVSHDRQEVDRLTRHVVAIG